LHILKKKRIFAAVMKISDYIQRIFRRESSVLHTNGREVLNPFAMSRFPFGNVIFLNIVELLTDLASEVHWAAIKKTDVVLFAEFRSFYDKYGRQILTRLYIDGFVIIGYKNGFRWLNSNEYYCISDTDATNVRPHDEEMQVYVMKSQTYCGTRCSDKQLLLPFLTFLDNVLNASNTVSARMGSVIVASPKNLTNSPTAVVLNKEQKDALEKETQDEYGALSAQKLFMVLPREMAFQVINLAGLDQRTTEKARMVILAIADRIKVPANQIAIIDANSSKSLSNGSELREGDYNKYQSFERLLNTTFLQLADSCGLKLTYTMDNKPKRPTEGLA